MHVDAKQALKDDGQAYGVRFGVYGLASRKFSDLPALDERFDRLDRQRRPTSPSKQSNDAGACEFGARKGWMRHLIRLERNTACKRRSDRRVLHQGMHNRTSNATFDSN